MAGDDIERGRLTWRCRRGMKELDLALRGWLDQHWRDAPAVERATFERILELPDPLLAAYLMGRETPDDPALVALVAVLRGCAGRADARARPAAAPDDPQP
jgi:antitoxin CptB